MHSLSLCYMHYMCVCVCVCMCACIRGCMCMDDVENHVSRSQQGGV